MRTTGRAFPNDRDKVFENGYSTTGDGTGFGLAAVADIVEAHSWEVTATGGESGGVWFEIIGTD